jgi:transcriptional regulator with XRE-family HTH domain
MRATIEMRRERSHAVAPIRETLKSQGRSITWLAGRIGIRRQALVNYLHGESRLPPGMLERICQAMDISPSFVRLDMNPELFLQPPRKPRPSRASHTRKGAHHDPSEHNTSNSNPRTSARSAQPATPTARGGGRAEQQPDQQRQRRIRGPVSQRQPTSTAS